MSKQATFNRVARHLLRQGERADDGGPTCVLHAANGLRCAAGVLVTRKDYDPNWEQHSGVDVASRSRLCQYLEAKGHDLRLVHDLQIMHDTLGPRHWAKALYGVAKGHGLNSGAIDECIAEPSSKGGAT